MQIIEENCQPLHNDTDEMMLIEPGERIAQLVVMEFDPIVFNIVNELANTEEMVLVQQELKYKFLR